MLAIIHEIYYQNPFNPIEIFQQIIDKLTDNKSTDYKQLDQEKMIKEKLNKFSLQKELQRITGVDFTKVPGLGVLSIQTIISEVGIDPSKWPSDKHFTSWLGLSPANKITGGKVFYTRTCLRRYDKYPKICVLGLTRTFTNT